MTEKYKRNSVDEEEKPTEDWWGEFLKRLHQKYKGKQNEQETADK